MLVTRVDAWAQLDFRSLIFRVLRLLLCSNSCHLPHPNPPPGPPPGAPPRPLPTLGRPPLSFQMVPDLVSQAQQERTLELSSALSEIQESHAKQMSQLSRTTSAHMAQATLANQELRSRTEYLDRQLEKAKYVQMLHLRPLNPSSSLQTSDHPPPPPCPSPPCSPGGE